MKNQCNISFCIVIFAVFFIVQPMRGQNDTPVLDKMKSFKKIILIDKLKMNEEQATRFFARYQQYEEYIKEAQKELEKALIQLDELQKTGKQEYGKAIQHVFDKDLAMRKTIVDRMKAMKGILSEQQYAQYILIEHRLLDNLQKMVKQRKNRMK
jgi:bacterioferritin (cytochrome b1)